MSLQQKLDAFKANFEANHAPPAAVEAFHRSIRELIENGNAEHALKAGERAPEFTLPDSDGNPTSSRALLLKGPLVLTFYRGVWCPYCNCELQALEEIVGIIRSHGASLLAISQQGASSSRKSQRENQLSYPILTDQGGELAERFGLRWTLQPYLIEFFEHFQVDLPKIHNDDKWTLPMPARYVIDTDSTIAYAEVNPDYTLRPEPSDLFPILEHLSLTTVH
ncbi:MAG: peroxiredoxin-like family protein [Cyanobacteria bacterium P01_H01_bin.15]